jgi:hypothetical protein
MGLPWRARGGGAARPPSRAATAAPFQLPTVRGTGGLSDRGVETGEATCGGVRGRGQADPQASSASRLWGRPRLVVPC